MEVVLPSKTNNHWGKGVSHVHEKEDQGRAAPVSEGGGIVLTDAEVRRLVIELLTQETERDRQTRVGASDLGNPCDRCLAHALLGTTNRDALTDRYWLGRVIGTALGGLAEDRALSNSELMPEKHIWFGEIPGYGKVGGSADLVFPDEDHLIDYKGAWFSDIALLEDLLQRLGLWRVGEKPRWEHMARGNYKLEVRTDTVMSLSAAKYEAGLEKMRYKMDQYCNQLTLYMHGGLGRRATLVFFARDGNGGFDNPALDGYEDPKRKHHIFTWGFDYDRARAEWLLDRATRIWERLESGSMPADFDAQELCFACSHDLQEQLHQAVIKEFEKTGEVAA